MWWKGKFSLSLSFYFSSSVSFFISLTILSLTHSSTVRRVRRLAQLNQSNGLSHAPQTFTISIPNTTEHKIFFICVCGGGGGRTAPLTVYSRLPKVKSSKLKFIVLGCRSCHDNRFLWNVMSYLEQTASLNYINSCFAELLRC